MKAERCESRSSTGSPREKQQSRSPPKDNEKDDGDIQCEHDREVLSMEPPYMTGRARTSEPFLYFWTNLLSYTLFSPST